MCRLLSEKGNPQLTSVTALLQHLGLRLAVEVGKPSSHRHRPRCTPLHWGLTPPFCAVFAPRVGIALGWAMSTLVVGGR